MSARSYYDISRVEGACSLFEVPFTDAHKALVKVNDQEISLGLSWYLDHVTAWLDTETGDLLVIAQPYPQMCDAVRTALPAFGIAALDFPEWLAPYRTSKGSAKTNAYLICRADRAKHYARLIRDLI